MALEVLGYRILVKKDEATTEEVRDSGIVVVKGNKTLETHRVNTGTVLGIGSTAFKAFSNDYTGKPFVKVGDRIVWSEYSDKVILDPETKEQYSVINDEDVIARVPNGN